MCRQIQIAIILGIFLSIGIEASSPNIELLQEIWKLRQSIITCTNRLNYACRCNPSKDATCEFKCIPLEKRCDGIPECPMGDDETDCPENPCKKGEVCCVDGGCASTCDGKAECPDAADETLCAPPVPSDCPGEMQCPSGACATVCDCDVECDDKPKDCEELDEKHCRYICESDQVVCNLYGECADWCNGPVECPNGYDESVCLVRCDDDQISCELESSGKGCGTLCDGTEQCEDSEDESDIYCGDCQDNGIGSGECLRS